MKRFHVHVSVASLDQSIGFYSTLFGQAPSVLKPDYAKWMLEEPRVNFAISTRAAQPGIDHLGIQVDDDDALTQIHARLEQAGRTSVEERGTDCCYARSDKYWTVDPSGIPWESFRSLESVPLFDAAAKPETSPEPEASAAQQRACCAPSCCT